LIARISGQYTPEKRIEQFHFADGVMWDYHGLNLQIPTQGTAGNDRLTGVHDTSNRLQGLEGDDTLIGGTLNDHLEGQQGNDTLIGQAGQDTLFGGQGCDLLEGGEGGDTYQFGVKASHDRIHDIDPYSNAIDKVVFNNLATTALTRVLRSGNDLVLQFGSTNTLTLVNQLLPFSRIESFAFVNGPVWGHSTLFNKVR
jgi:Ca2+-binding RTX toxin-like protein